MMSEHSVITGARLMLLAGIVASGVYSSPLRAQSAPPASKPAKAAAHLRYQPSRFPKRAREVYGLVLGVDTLSVKSVESGELIKFSYRVVDAQKAKFLNDKKQEPYLFDEQAHVKLSVPVVDKVGQLRQSSTPEAGRVYWMLFSNKGGYVKRGDRVSVMIGKVHVDGLVVD